MAFHLCAVLLAFVAAGCSSAINHPFHVRGELDREKWTVRPCDSGDSYQLVFASNQEDYFKRLEKKLGAKRSEPLIVDFEAFAITRSMLRRPESVGLVGPIYLERGSCSRAGR